MVHLDLANADSCVKESDRSASRAPQTVRGGAVAEEFDLKLIVLTRREQY
jgi:hypothetical protein